MTPVHVGGGYVLRKRVEYYIIYVPVVDQNGQDVEALHGGRPENAYAYIAVRSQNVSRHVERNGELPTRLHHLANALQVHSADKTSIPAENPL